VFLTAVLENSPDSYERYDAPDARSRAAFFVGLAVHGLVSVLALIFGVLVMVAAYVGGVAR
jgi:hypothetical protein